MPISEIVGIDRPLGREAPHQTQGTTISLTGISTTNLRQTIETISYPETIFTNLTIYKGTSSAEWLPIQRLARWEVLVTPVKFKK